MARPPGSEDLAAVAEEVASQPDFVFLRPADLVGRGEPSSAVLLLTAAELAQLAAGARPEEHALHRYAVTSGRRRAVLLDHYGEPVAVPCGGCDRCAPDAGPPVR